MEEIARTAANADLVLLGMSSSPELAEPEIVAGNVARKAGIPYGFYGDIPRCWGRARSGVWFEELASSAAFYFGVTQADADEACEVFENAQLVGTGNPLREEMAFPRFTREEVRSQLKIAPEEKLVLAPGGKVASGNIASWVVLSDALTLLASEGTRFQVILATHPGDRTPYAVDSATQKEMRIYEELVRFSPVPMRIVGKDAFTTSDLVPAADIIVEYGSSIGIEGAYQGVPVVSLGFEMLFRRHEEHSGTRILEAVKDGLSELVVADASKLAEAVGRLLTPAGFAKMRTRQLEVCPKPTERGVALSKMAEFVASL